MEGKIGGTVRQIEGGDELSGSIINPHPLLFNILKTHTHTHIPSRAAAPCNTTTREEQERSGSKYPPNVKGICCVPKVLKRFPLSALPS